MPPAILSAEQFIDEMIDQVDDGYGFVPLTGSGLSVLSGIPTGRVFAEYLSNCIYQILEGRIDWDPHHPTWPTLEDLLPGKEEVANPVEAILTLLASQRSVGREMLLEAVGAMANWRSALHYLSRLPAIQAKKGRRTPTDSLKIPRLGGPDETVIDSAFLKITEDAEPNTAHFMLAHLANALRIETVLTTNFDTLIERAFLQLGIPLRTFDVHQKAGLPSAQLVLGEPAIVKLHGGRYGLRADFTLDEGPSCADKDAFAGYFAEPMEVPLLHEATRFENRKHLLVMGVSGTDVRTMLLIKDAVERSKDVHVYWVCFTRNEAGLLGERLRLSEGRASSVSVTVAMDLGLFLFELYQRLYLSLPPAGADYPSDFRVPPLRYDTPDEVFNDGFDSVQEELRSAIQNHPPPPLVLFGGEKAGASSVAASVFENIYDEVESLWLDLAQFSDCDEFLVNLTDAIAYRLGRRLTLPPIPSAFELAGDTSADSPTTGNPLSEMLRKSDRRFLVFVNGRDIRGRMDADRTSADSPFRGNWSSKEAEKFWDVLATILNKCEPLLRFVVLHGNNGLERPFASLTSRSGWHQVDLKDSVLKLDRTRIVASAMATLFPDPQDEDADRKLRFVYALTLFRRARPPAALWTWGLAKAKSQLSDKDDNDSARRDDATSWIKELIETHAVRRQPGGAIWMHEDVRIALQKAVAERGGEDITLLEAECHQGIADWYVKLFRSSNGPRAAFEALYHRYSCMRSDGQDLKQNEKATLRGLQETALLESLETLRLVRAPILANGHMRSFVFVLGQLKERAGDRDVKEINPEAADMLCELCEKLLRDFRREVGEYRA